VTLPQFFKENGYTTVGYGKIFDGRCSDGWVTQDRRSWTANTAKGASGKLYALPENENSESGKPRGAPVEKADVADNVYKDGKNAELAVEELQKLAQGDQPFFLAVGFSKPHLPFTAPSKYWELFEREQFDVSPVQAPVAGSPDYAWQDSWELKSGYWGIPERGEPIPEDLQRELIHGYYASTSFVDAQVGKVLDELDRLGLRDDTIVILWGDHGFHLGDHGMFCKHTNYEQATRVPMIIAAPGMAADQKTAALTEFVDIYPTLVELAGFEIPEYLEGQSMLPLLEGAANWDKQVAISQYRRTNDGQELMGHSLRSDRYRYTVWRQWDKGADTPYGEVVDVEFFDYAKDPLETANLADDPAYTEVIEAFEARLKDYDAQFNRGVKREG